MAYQVGSACYSTALQAMQALASSIPPHNDGENIVTVVGADALGLTYRMYTVAAGSGYNTHWPVSLQPCNMLEAADAVSLGWAIGGAWLSVYAITFLIRYFWNETHGGNNAGDA